MLEEAIMSECLTAFEQKLNKTLSRKLIAIRESNQLTQEQAAELCDISVRYWGKIERCHASVSLETLQKISIGLNMKASDLLNENRETGK